MRAAAAALVVWPELHQFSCPHIFFTGRAALVSIRRSSHTAGTDARVWIPKLSRTSFCPEMLLSVPPRYSGALGADLTCGPDSRAEPSREGRAGREKPLE